MDWALSAGSVPPQRDHAGNMSTRDLPSDLEIARAEPLRPISEVAMSVGYASHSHMSTDFQAALAMTPSGVRDRYARRSAEASIFNLR